MSKSIGKKANQYGKNANLEDGATVASCLQWDDLQLLLALCRAGTLLGAAERIAVNISTVARRLDSIEELIGAALFDRTSKGLLPNALAEALVPVAESMERSAAEATFIVEGRETKPEGTVRITAPPGLANWCLAPTLVELRTRFPGI